MLIRIVQKMIVTIAALAMFPFVLALLAAFALAGMGEALRKIWWAA